MIFNPRHGNGAFAGMNTRNGNKGHDFRFQRRMGSADFLLISSASSTLFACMMQTF